MSALDLFELAILPTLLYNCETWVGINKETEERVENLQLFYLRLALRVPQSTPKLALRSETGLMSMKLRIWREKNDVLASCEEPCRGGLGQTNLGVTGQEWVAWIGQGDQGDLCGVRY